VIKRVLVACVAAVLLAPTACGNDKPKTEPTTTPTRSSSPSPTTPTTRTPPPQRPKLPTAARLNSDAGARAFSRYFVAVLWYTSVTGKTSLLSRLSEDGCSNCVHYVQNIQTIYRSNGWIRAASTQTRSTAIKQRLNDAYVVDVKTTNPTQLVKESKNASPVTKRRASERLRLGIEWKDARWVVGAFDAL
jgi:hypothetical protein